MSTTVVKLALDDALLARVQRAVDDGHAGSIDGAMEDAIRAWLRSVGSKDDLAIEFDAYAELLLHERVSYHGGRVHVFGDESYVNEIEFCQDAFHDYGAFAKMPLKVRERVAGFGTSNGYLGRMEGAARFKPVVRDTPGQIGEYLDRLPIAGPVSMELLRDVLLGLCSVHGVGLPSASRLLAVKRPDLYLPVNGANREEVVRRFGQVRVLPEPAAEDYIAIIERIHAYPWYNSKRPPKSEVDRRSTWDYRVALLDVLLYAPTEVSSKAGAAA